MPSQVQLLLRLVGLGVSAWWGYTWVTDPEARCAIGYAYQGVPCTAYK